MSAVSKSHRIVAMVHASRGGMTARMIADRLYQDYKTTDITALCASLVRRGFLKVETRPSIELGRPVNWYLATDKPHVPRPGWANVAEPVREVLERDGPLSVADLAYRAGRSRRAVSDALYRMRDAGEVTVTRQGSTCRWAIVDDEDDGWQPPTQYVSALRAQILGLKRAA